MKIIIIRHGKTYSNEINKDKTVFFVGNLNNHLTDLTEEGRKMAMDIRKSNITYGVKYIYCSFLARAVDTAEIININSKIIKTNKLKERSLGIYEGKLLKDLKNDDEFKKYIIGQDKYSFRTSFDVRCPGGENYIDVIKRTKKFLESLNMKDDSTICIVSHYHTIRCLLYNLLNIKKEDILNLKINNCTPYVLEGNSLHNFKIISNNLKI